MIRKKDNQKVELKNIRQGIGEVKLEHILNNPEEMFMKGRMFAKMTVPVGNSIGLHAHDKDNEIFYILSGTGEYYDNGTKVVLEPGDTTICKDTEEHSLVNTGTEDLVLIALILYN